MSRESTDVFARRPDTDWEMFCRGRRDDGPSWVYVGPHSSTAGEHGSGPDWLAEPDENVPVPLSPGDGEHGGDREAQPRSAPAGVPAGPPHVRHFHAKVVGVSYPNPDGSSRIEAVRGLKVRELVRLEHRP